MTPRILCRENVYPLDDSYITVYYSVNPWLITLQMELGYFKYQNIPWVYVTPSVIILSLRNHHKMITSYVIPVKWIRLTSFATSTIDVFFILYIRTEVTLLSHLGHSVGSQHIMCPSNGRNEEGSELYKWCNDSFDPVFEGSRTEPRVTKRNILR